jgi:MFS transporter, DHA1 family, solute carrier family 18 (vesicular amine transporter), member 1/2
MLARARSGSGIVAGVVGFALFMDYLTYGLLIPLTAYSPAHVTSEQQFGLLYGAYAVGILAATPFFGYLGDRIDYRRLMIAGVVLSAAALTLFSFAAKFSVLLLGRWLQGAASAATWTAGLALIAAHYRERRVEMMGLALMGSTGGSLLGPVIGGSLHELGGYTLPFAATGVLVAIDAGLRVFLLPRDQAGREGGIGIGPLLLDGSVVVAAAAVALAAIGWGIVEPLLPAHLARAGMSPAVVGLIFTIAAIAYGLSAPVVAWVSNRVPIRRLIAGGTAAMAVALPFLSLFGGAVSAAIGLCAVSVCYAFMLNPTSAELGNAVDRRGLTCYAAVYALYNIAYALGQMAASGFASAASASLGFFHTLLCVSAALIVFAPLLLRDYSPPQASSQPSAQPQPIDGVADFVPRSHESRETDRSEAR